ncbi:restriction endonuclease subunit S [Psittacicella melopsittaci]|uniref:restriction endonuclease subunit S n=1 Tax=Psittacicella melopsittaci TaxID=2028576 RepID=UPI00249F030D|nr:restriction endonuclease subunit S [Psittacicella melopsittaci]
MSTSKLGELISYSNGKGYEKEQQSSGKYELINLNSVDINGGLKPSGKFVDNADETLKKNDLVMVLSDLAHGNLLGKVALIPEDNKYVLNQRVGLLRIKDKRIDPYYLFTYINRKQAYFKLMGGGTSQLNLNKDPILRFKVRYPEIIEQQKVGNLFKEIDDKISSLQIKLSKFKILKIALQGLLYTDRGNPKLRFPDFKEDYHTLRVSEIGEVKTGNTPSTKVKEYWGSNTDETKYIWVTPTDINSSTIERTERILTSLGWEKARKVPANSLLITCIASIGKNTINLTPAAFNQQINSLTPKQGFDVYYLLHQFNRSKIRLANAGNSSITEIVNKAQFEEFTLRLPKEYEEQRKIGKLFKEVDQLILTYKSMIEHYKLLKQALLQRMFI